MSDATKAKRQRKNDGGEGSPSIERADYLLVVSLALATDSIIYWHPTPTGVQPLLQHLTPQMWQQVEHGG